MVKFNFIYFFIFIFGQGFTQSLSSEKMIKPLQSDLLVYNEHHEAYVPVLKNNVSKIDIVGFVLDANKYSSCILTFNVKKGVSLFIDNKLYRNFHKEETIYLKIKSLTIINNGLPFLVFSGVYNTDLASSLRIITYIYERLDTKKESSMWYKLPKLGGIKQTYMVIGTFFFLFTLSLIKVLSPKTFRTLFYIFPINKKEDDLVSFSGIDRFKLIYILFCSFIISFIISSTQINDESSIMKIVGFIFYNAGIIVCYFISKYLFINLISVVYGSLKAVHVQYFLFFKYSVFLAVVYNFLFIIDYFSVNFNYYHDYWKTTMFFIAFLLLLFNIGIVVKKYSGFRNMYLISYLCITEITPLVLFFKLY